MFKKLLLGIAAITALFHFSSKAQSLPEHYIPIEGLQKGLFPCGADLTFFQSLAKTSPIGSPTSIILPASFPASAIDTCGKFRVFYVDKAISLTEGFDDPVSGNRRRAIVCDVLSYVQSVIDFSSIPSGEYIRLYVDTSFTSLHPIYFPTTYVARAGANYLSSSTGVVNGYVHEFIKSGTDPTSLVEYHAVLQMNFDKVNYADGSGALSDTIHKPVSFYDSLGAVPHCMVDMYSTVLHEITHALGWHSLMSIYPSSTVATKYSSIDTSVHATTFKTSLTTLTNNFSGGYILYDPSTKNIWINNKREPNNFPVYITSTYYRYSDWATNFTHLDDQQMTYADLQRVSPGDCQEFVMSPFSRDGVSRRVYTKAEILTLRDLFTYSLTSSLSGSTTVTNHTPWSSKMSSVLYSGFFTGDATKIYHEKIPADTILTNDTGVVWTFHLSSDTTLKDIEGDVLSVYPNSLVNFRGCGAGNDHNQVSVSSDGKTITYTPKQNFVGRAQFGFNLYDGHEKGGFVLYTVDVYRGNKVGAKPGDELVLNGNFESGSEVKIRISDEGINNTATEAGRSGRIYGSHFSDSHPFDYWSWGWMPYGGGTIVRNSLADCDSMGYSTRGFGSETINFPQSSMGFPIPHLNGGNRYHPAFANSSLLFYLADSVHSCKRYILEMDVYSPYWSAFPPTKEFELNVGFTDTGKMGYANFSWLKFTDVNVYYKLKPAIPFTLSSNWTHINVPFTYCSDTAADMLCIRTDNYDMKYLFDNISIKEDTTKLVVSIEDSVMIPCSNSRLYAKAANYSVYSCIDTFGTKLKYIWEANGDTISADSIIYVMPKDTTKYVITIYDGCRFTKDSITLLPAIGPVVVVRDTSICSGDTILMPLTITGTSGTTTYSWTPTTGLSCISCSNPFVFPSSTTTYTLTVTDSLGCFKRDIKITVVPTPVFTATDVTICSGTKTTLSVTGVGKFKFKWDDPTLSCDTCTTVNTPILTTTTNYLVSATNILGCIKYDTATVTVHPIAYVTVTPRDTTICKGDSVSILVTGGFGHNWTPPTGLSCITCSNPMAKPTITTVYTVNVTDSSGCHQSKTSIIRINPDPIVVAIPADTALCGAASINISASGAGSYLWTPSTGIASPTSASTVAYVSSTRSIVVTGTDSIGCIGKDTINITVNTPPTVSATTPIINTCTTDSITLTAIGATTYSWSPTTGFTCPTCNPTKVAAPATSATYIVTGTDANGCTDTGKVVINANVCACTPGTVFGTTATTLTGTIPTTISSGYYYLPNSITISSNTVMTGAKILIERGVTITVANTAKLTLDGCHLFTCDEDTSKAMWNGIVLASTGPTPGGTSGRIEVKNNTLIEDAQTAITAIYPKIPSSGDIISSIHSIYNRNQLDIYVQGLNVSSPSTYPFTIKSNVFTARKFSRTSMTGYPNTWASANSLKTTITPIDAKPSYSLNRNYPRAMAKDSVMKYMGISIQYVGLTTGAGVSFAEMVIGGSNSVDSANLFDNHKYGIYSNRSNVTVYNGTFINLSKRYNPSTVSAAVLPDWGGLGIFARSDSARYDRMRILSSSGNVTNRFHDCFDAMAMDNMAEFTVSFAEVTTSHQVGNITPGAAYPTEVNAGTGMWIAGHKNHSKWAVTNSIFSNVSKGITAYLQNPKATATTNFDNNKFYNANPASAYASFKGKQYTYLAIEATMGGVGFDNTFTANGNYMDKVFNGIAISNLRTSKPTVNTNQISLWDTLISGITSSGQFAIRMNNCKTGTISTNTISTPTLNPVLASGDRIKGVFANFNTDLKVCTNNITNIGRAFEFGGKTGQTGTRWIDNTITNSYKGFVLGSDIGDQGFMYNDLTLTPRTFYGATLNKWNGSWSIATSRYHTITIDSANPAYSRLYVNTSSAVELPSVNGVILSSMPIKYKYSYPTTVRTPTSQWNANCIGGLYPTKTSSVPIGGVGKSFASLLMADSLEYGDGYRPNQWMGQLSLYQMGVFDPELRDSIHELNDFMIAAENSRYKWITDIEMAFANDTLSLVQELLDNPNRGNGYEFVDTNIAISDYEEADYVVANYTDYYTIYLHYLQGSMTADDSTLLYELAQKCPAKDGAVVYQARGLQSQINKEVVEYDDEGCLYGTGAQYRLAPPLANDGNYNNGYRLYPNPNDGNFSISQYYIDDKIVEVKLYNALGVLLSKEKIQFSNGVANFKVQNASAGLYLICLTEENQRTTCLKFNIK